MGRCQALLARWPRLEAASTAARPYLPPLNFITLHYAYFLLVCLVFTLVFWGASEPRLSISFVDSLYCVVSAMSEAGLNTVSGLEPSPRPRHRRFVGHLRYSGRARLGRGC